MKGQVRGMPAMKRGAPEEFFDAGPLFAAEHARMRADVGMTRAAVRAERKEPGWKDVALDAVRRHALGHPHFMAEEVPIGVPEGADPRAVGAVFQEARRRGWIKADGYAPANSSNRSPKVRWQSRICSS